MKVYLRELLEDRIQVLEKEIFKNSNIPSEDLSMDEMQDLEAKIFDQKIFLIRVFCISRHDTRSRCCVNMSVVRAVGVCQILVQTALGTRVDL